MSVAAAAAIGVAAFNIYSGREEAKGIAQQAQLAQDIADMNAEFIDLDAWEAEKFGYTQEARYGAIIDKTIASQRVSLAASDVDVNSATAKAVQDETRLIGQLNVIDIQRQARAKARGLKLEASNLRLGSSFSQTQARSNASAAEIRGVSNAAAIGAQYFASQA
jgi:hypothetical protein